MILHYVRKPSVSDPGATLGTAYYLREWRRATETPRSAKWLVTDLRTQILIAQSRDASSAYDRNQHR